LTKEDKEDKEDEEIDILTAVFALGVPVRAASPSGEGYALLRRSNE
jgi:hypothetical protein